jgi:hypothetical protein
MSYSTKYSIDGKSHPFARLDAALSPIDFKYTMDLDVEKLILSPMRQRILLNYLREIFNEDEFREITEYFDLIDLSYNTEIQENYHNVPEHIGKILSKIDKELFDALVDADRVTNGRLTIRGLLKDECSSNRLLDDDEIRYLSYISDKMLHDQSITEQLIVIKKTRQDYLQAVDSLVRQLT